MKCLVIGGHLTPALGLLSYLKATDSQAVFIGREQTSNHPSALAHEADEIAKLGYRFIPYNSPKFDRFHPLRSLIKVPQFIPAFIKAGQIIRQEMPDVIVGFGGYLELPFLIAARRLHIPSVIHEQTAVAGLANQLASRLVSAVALSYPMSRRYFPAAKTVLTGNLLRPEMFVAKTPAPAWAPYPLSKPLLYITGGNQGSVTINQAVTPIYPQLIQEFYVVHQTGQQDVPGSYADCLAAKDALPKRSRSELVIKPWLTASEVAWIYGHAHLVISRSGANTLAELAAMSLPCILVPLPKTHLNEQAVHARLVSTSGGGLVLDSATLSSFKLLAAIHQIVMNYPRFFQGIRNLRPLVNPFAARDLFALMQKIAKHRL